MIIRKEQLEAVLPATTRDDTRYVLKAVLIEPGGSIIATNGHVLLRAEDPHPYPDEDFPSKNVPEFKGSPNRAVLLDADAAKGLIKAMPQGKRTTIPILKAVQVSANGDDGATVVATDLDSVRTAHADVEGKNGSFPKYDRVLVGPDRPHLSVCLSTEVLEALIKSAKAVSDTKLTTITFEIPTEEKHQERDQPECRFQVDLSVPALSLPKNPVCTACGKCESEHVGKPNGKIVSQIRVVFGQGIKVDGVIMPCRV